MRVREFFQDLEKREIALVIFTGLVVAWVRHGLQYHWKAWDSWEDFFIAWFIHTMGVALLMAVSLAAIIILAQILPRIRQEGLRTRADVLHCDDDIGYRPRYRFHCAAVAIG